MITHANVTRYSPLRIDYASSRALYRVVIGLIVKARLFAGKVVVAERGTIESCLHRCANSFIHLFLYQFIYAFDGKFLLYTYKEKHVVQQF